MTRAFLNLDPKDMLASGKQRAVYLHPFDDSKLVKVLLTQADTEGRSKFSLFLERWLPSTRDRQIRKEYLEYLRLMLSNQGAQFRPPITHMFGFVSTQLGLGCLTERVQSSKGVLGDTLFDLIEQGRLTQEHVEMLNDTVARLYELNIRASDLTARNFVFGRRQTADGLGPKECVLVDGFGDIHAVPVRTMANWANRMGLDDSMKRLCRNKPIAWDQTQRRFSYIGRD
ncbi:YrbL family protein [Loktanella sp. S4079]|uniref:YrbL family protein n=1 Tax=Loktanella sp. S4079 TaxID=579483 RepID=UPI0005FA3F25|nr:YrbL family protein [Loktanella sp. S4079]KJZ18916.1 hypothetical protein TW80_12630 [Loktanella sp. S4079]